MGGGLDATPEWHNRSLRHHNAIESGAPDSWTGASVTRAQAMGGTYQQERGRRRVRSNPAPPTAARPSPALVLLLLRMVIIMTTITTTTNAMQLWLKQAQFV